MAKMQLLIVMGPDDTPESIKKLNEGGEPLLSLCRETVEAFSKLLEKTPGFEEGAVSWEKRFGEGLLYQLARGRLFADDAVKNEAPAPNAGAGV